MFNHTELPQSALIERYEELEALQGVPHTDERARQIGHEMLCLLFELNQRSEEAGLILREQNGISTTSC